MSRKITIDTVTEWLDTHRPEFKLLSEIYVSSKSNLQLECPSGHVFYKRWDQLQRGQGCKLCAIDTQRKPLSEIEKWIAENTTFTLLSTSYVNDHTPLMLTCPNGHTFSKTWNGLLSGQGCGVCSPSRKKTLLEIESWLRANTQLRLLPEQQYISAKSPISVVCSNGHTTVKTWDAIRSGSGCSHCAGNIKKSISEVTEWVVANTNFSLIATEYINSGTPLEMKCSNEHTFFISWDNLKQGKGCPHCHNKSEARLGSILADTYLVERQFRITCPMSIRKSGCIYVDFFLPQINTVVEYHGPQHYMQLPHMQTLSEFQAQQARDQWLREYCKDLKINYVEIPYYLFNHTMSNLPDSLSL